VVPFLRNLRLDEASIGAECVSRGDVISLLVLRAGRLDASRGLAGGFGFGEESDVEGLSVVVFGVHIINMDPTLP